MNFIGYRLVRIIKVQILFSTIVISNYQKRDNYYKATKKKKKKALKLLVLSKYSVKKEKEKG